MGSMFSSPSMPEDPGAAERARKQKAAEEKALRDNKQMRASLADEAHQRRSGNRGYRSLLSGSPLGFAKGGSPIDPTNGTA